MIIPAGTEYLLRRLQDAGYEAYAVGGCVRDTLMGRTPEDWDICTSARPEETGACFSELRVLGTGAKHGTVTVLLKGTPYEITTFRREGAYRDHRTPETVTFVSELREDLLRRDFTVNAMAVDGSGKVIDLYGGREDLQKGLLRAVGVPDARFQEDALRILRGMRFASQLGFQVEPETKAAMLRNRALLRYVSGERIYQELTKLLLGENPSGVLREFSEILGEVLPEILPSVGFWQHNPHHYLDVWEHTLAALHKSQLDKIVRWTLLLHDLGKPEAFYLDEKGIGHFGGHPDRSAELAEAILRRLHVDNDTRERICLLVKYHDDDLPASRKNARRLLSDFGEEALGQLMEARRCDILAHSDTELIRRRYENHLNMMEWLRRVIQEEGRIQQKDLKIRGKDLLELGVPAGPQVGRLLGMLLEDVLEERCENDRVALEIRAGEYLAYEKEEKHDT